MSDRRVPPRPRREARVQNETRARPQANLPAAPAFAGMARVLLLAAADGLALLLAGAAAFLLWAHAVRHQPASVYLPVAPVVLLVILGYAQAGLYPGFGLGPVEKLRRYSLVTATAFLALAALTFALKLPAQYSRVTLTLAMVLSFFVVPAMRWAAQRIGRRFSWWPEPVLLIGEGRRTELAQRVLDGAGGEFRAVGIVTTSDDVVSDLPVLGSLDELESVNRTGVRMAFADLPRAQADEALDRLRAAFPRLIILSDFQALPVEGVQVRNLGRVLGLEYGNNLLRRQSRWVKRTIDILVGGVAFLLALPLMGLAMVAVKLLSPGPALFLQEREGRHGRTIRVPKIRTMVADAEERMEEILETDPAIREEWNSGFKLRQDPRIIPGIGRWLRRFSIDELPQLWSVLTGDMSLVGPRPFPAYHLEALSERSRALRSQVRPGLTGLWQIEARGVADAQTQQSHDIYYIRNWSLWLDLYILGWTIFTVLSGRGAY